jgi:hypothetical protein
MMAVDKVVPLEMGAANLAVLLVVARVQGAMVEMAALLEAAGTAVTEVVVKVVAVRKVLLVRAVARVEMVILAVDLVAALAVVRVVV